MLYRELWLFKATTCGIRMHAWWKVACKWPLLTRQISKFTTIKVKQQEKIFFATMARSHIFNVIGGYHMSHFRQLNAGDGNNYGTMEAAIFRNGPVILPISSGDLTQRGLYRLYRCDWLPVTRPPGPGSP